jgi:hypothetical protein
LCRALYAERDELRENVTDQEVSSRRRADAVFALGPAALDVFLVLNGYELEHLSPSRSESCSR